MERYLSESKPLLKKLLDGFRCLKCRLLIRKPVKAPCFHVHCKKCWISTGKFCNNCCKSIDTEVDTALMNRFENLLKLVKLFSKRTGSNVLRFETFEASSSESDDDDEEEVVDLMTDEDDDNDNDDDDDDLPPFDKNGFAFLEGRRAAGLLPKDSLDPFEYPYNLLSYAETWTYYMLNFILGQITAK